MLEDAQARLGNTLSINNNFCRPILVGDEIKIEAQIVSSRENKITIKNSILSSDNKLMFFGFVVKEFNESCDSIHTILEKLHSNTAIRDCPYTGLHTGPAEEPFSKEFYKTLTDRTDLQEREKMQLSIAAWWTGRWKTVRLDEEFSVSLSNRSFIFDLKNVHFSPCFYFTRSRTNS